MNQRGAPGLADGPFVPAESHLPWNRPGMVGDEPWLAPSPRGVVAEHVENEATLELLRGFGVDYVQGYLVGREAPVGYMLGRRADAHRGAA